MSAVQSFDHAALQAICDIIADTSEGITGSDIGRLLNRCLIDDIDAGGTKKHRLFNALSAKQSKDGCANNVIAFIQSVMDPVRYVANPEQFDSRRLELNVVLSFRGYEIGTNGRLQLISKVETLPEAEQRARTLRYKLEGRNIHADVLRFCKAELLQDNYFHAVFEATKSVADKIRDMSGLTGDGAELVDEAFSIKRPLVALSKLVTETEQSEQKGFAMLLKGIFGTFRNTTGHAPKIKWTIEEQDAMDLMTMVSYAHRKLDSAVSTGLAPKPKGP